MAHAFGFEEIRRPPGCEGRIAPRKEASSLCPIRRHDRSTLWASPPPMYVVPRPMRLRSRSAKRWLNRKSVVKYQVQSRNARCSVGLLRVGGLSLESISTRRPAADARLSPQSIQWPRQIGESGEVFAACPASHSVSKRPIGFGRVPAAYPWRLHANYQPAHADRGTDRSAAFTSSVTSQPAKNTPTAQHPNNSGRRFLPLRASHLSLPLVACEHVVHLGYNAIKSLSSIAESVETGGAHHTRRSKSSLSAPLSSSTPGSAMASDLSRTRYCIVNHNQDRHPQNAVHPGNAGLERSHASRPPPVFLAGSFVLQGVAKVPPSEGGGALSAASRSLVSGLPPA